MKFVWAVIAFILGATCIGLGFIDRALVERPTETSMSVTTKGDSPFTLVTSEMLRAVPGEQTLDVRTDGEVFAAIGRTTDIEAWLAKSDYTEILPPEDVSTLKPEVQAVASQPVEAADEEAASATPAEAPTEAAPNPAGSDLWLTEQTEPDRLVMNNQLPEGVSVLLATNAEAPTPLEVTLSWPLVHNTPWTGPLIIAGSLFLLIGIVLYIQAIREHRRGIGPRRKGPKELSPGAGEATPAIAPAKSRRAIRSFVAVPVAVTLLATGCTAEMRPAQTPTPTATETAAAGEVRQPALVPQQAARILDRVALLSLEADEANSADIAADRLSGEALKERTAEYTLKAALPDRTVAPLLPTTEVKVLLPQANDAWPRTALVAVGGATETDAPVVVLMTQEDPWSNYKVSYRAEFIAGVQVPKLPPDWSGASLIPPGLPLFVAPPETVGEAFADVIDNGDQSQYYALFDDNALAYAQSIREKRAAANEQLKTDDADTTSKYTWKTSVSDSPAIALSTWESGALVATALEEHEEFVPTVPEAVIRTESSPAVKALTGKDELEGGVRTVYGMQLFFSVPSEVSGQKIALLAKDDYLQSIVEIPKPDNAE